MKKERNQFLNAKRILSFLLALTLFLSNIDFKAYAAIINTGIQFLNYLDMAEEIKKSNSVTLRSAADFVALSDCNAADYKNHTITIAPTDTESLELPDTFKGFGSADHPFAGKISTSGQYTGSITLNKSLFNAIDQSAEITPLNLKVANNMSDPVFAGSIVNTENNNTPLSISLTLSAASYNDTEDESNKKYSTFGGIIGSIDNAAVSISVTNSFENNKGVVSGNGNRGFICNTMQGSASLTITEMTNAGFDVTSTDASAGALVGYMGAGTTLKVEPEILYSGSVNGSSNAGGLVGEASSATIYLLNNYSVVNGDVNTRVSSANQNAGGLVGLFDYSVLNLAEGKTVTIDKITVGAKDDSGAGGMFGVYKANSLDLDLSKYNINVSITSGKYSGGLFGVLENKQKDGSAEVTGEGEMVISGAAGTDSPIPTTTVTSTGAGSIHYGGLIGRYYAHKLSYALQIENISVNSTHKEQKTSYGGVIACVDGKSYVSFDSLNVVPIQQSENGKYYGGLVAIAGDVEKTEATGTTAFFNVGSVTINTQNGNNDNKVDNTNGYYGGVIGYQKDGVLRFHGTTDLSYIKPKNEGSLYGQIMGYRGNVLVYALGDGSDAEGSKWTLKRPFNLSLNSDIGNWGEVVRNIDDASDNGIIKFDSAAHTATIGGVNTTSINGKDDFIKLALSMQCKGGESNGALRITTEVDLNAEITLGADVDLTDTGVLGLLRDDGSQVFSGKIHGNNHTITLDIGDPYGVYNSNNDDYGHGQIYNHPYMGLLAKTGNGVTVENLTVNGKVYTGNVGNNNNNGSGSEIYAGGLVGVHTGGMVTFTNVTSDVDMSLRIGNDNQTLYAGGFCGYVHAGTEISFDSCTWTGSMTTTGSKNYFCIGGYIACMEGNDNNPGKITVTDSKIGNGEKDKATISSAASGTSVLGGLLGSTKGNNKQITITVNGLTIDGFDITSSSTDKTGGFLGYEWNNVTFDVTGLTIQNSTLSSRAGFGGLVYQSSGYWKIHDNGVQFVSDVNITGKSVDATQDAPLSAIPSALLVCRGDDYNNNNLALYLQITSKDAYKISGVGLELVSGQYFDELVGVSIGENGNGVVSIATTDDKINQKEINTYQKQLGTDTDTDTDYDNPRTRYYYNLDKYSVADGDITSGSELLMWSVGQYCESNIHSYFSNIKKNGDVTIGDSGSTVNIDLTGLSYYPVDYSGKMTITGAQITFDYNKINSLETGNKLLNNEKKQHYMMQTGILLSLTREGTSDASLTVNSSSLSGSIGKTQSGSGALIVSSMHGCIVDNKVCSVSVSIDGLTLAGIYVDGVDEKCTFAPLLINSADSNSTISIKNVTTTDEYAESNIGYAATSLLGTIGNGTATNMLVYFENMKLDSRKTATSENVKLYGTFKSIFKKATFMESFAYAQDSGSRGYYNFTEEDTVKDTAGTWTGNVTYGVEISNTNSGRNPGKQYYYFGSTKKEVTDGMFGTTAQNFTKDNYLRYVYVVEGVDGKAYFHEIDINIQSVSIENGCGTYDDPFIIKDGKQLEELAGYISTGVSTGWEVNLPYAVVSGLTSDSTSSSTHLINNVVGHYKYTSGASTWTTTDGEKNLSNDYVLVYMRNAYYMITEDIELPETFYGIGGPDPSKNTFSGVIVGKKADGSVPCVKITAQGTTKTFGGLIMFSQGSVVKDLIIDFSGMNAKNDTDNAAENDTKDTFKIESQEPSQERSKQSFFGGVIGYIVGGDNIIDNVEIKNLSADKIIVDGSNVKIVDIGGYVGLIGGNLQSGGGVIFRNIDVDNNSITVTDFAGNNTFYYRNTYVGRVLDGYACSEDCVIDNTDKNYTISQLTQEKNKLTVSSETISNKTTYTITINSAQQLWVLSAIVNSGAGGDKNDTNHTYNNDAYKYGRVRTGSYANVGSNVAENSNEASDNTYWGGMKTTGQVSYLVKEYASSNSNDAAKLTNGTGCKVNFTSDCDMTSYKNGFRGIGTMYQDNNSSSILDRSIGITSINGNNHKVTMMRDVHEYASEGTTGDTVGWWAQGIGLFSVIYFKSEIKENNKTLSTVQNLTLSGKLSISYEDDRANKNLDYIGETSIGGFAGMTAKERDNNSTPGAQKVCFTSVLANNLSVTGSKYSGGFIGVVGQSSRTDIKTKQLLQVSTTVGDYTFDGCRYDTLKVEGGYSAGGFIGTFKNDKKTVTIKGTTELKNATIGWTKDACLEMYSVLNGAKDASKNAKENGYSGGGGIIGYYYGGDMKVNAYDSNAKKYTGTMTLTNINIYGPQFAYNCDYGLGGIIGLQAIINSNGGGLTLNNATFDDVAIRVVIDENYKGKHDKKTEYLKIYTTPACGLFKGYTRTDMTATDIIVKNCYVLNSGYCGGLMGHQGKAFTLTNCSIDGLTVFSKNTGSFSGSSKVGGLIAGSVRNVDIKQLTMNNVSVISDGNTGLIAGMKDEAEDFKLTDVYATNCVVATTQDTSAKYFLAARTDPGSNNTELDTDNAAGTAGMFIGCCKKNNVGSNTHNGDGLSDKALKIKGFNIGVDNLVLGYYCDKTEGIDYVFDENSFTGHFEKDKTKITLSEKNIGVYIAPDPKNSTASSGKSYAQIADEGKKNSDYLDGYLGLITGGKRSNDYGIQIVGLSVNDSHIPYELNGNDDCNFAKKDNTANGTNYVIFSDYLGNSFKENKNTDGTKGIIKNGYPTSASVNAPYVIINAAPDLMVYKDSTGMKLTSDGMNKEAKDAIVSDLVGTTNNKPIEQRYDRVSYYDNKSYEKTAKKFDRVNGIYKDKLSTFKEASESTSGVTDFDVLLIDITDSREITLMLHEYISVLTNCDQSGSFNSTGTRFKEQYTSLTAYTYQWDGEKFVKVENSSLIINDNHSISVRAGAHDNQRNQFTVLDVFYQNPSNSGEGYHLFIPVVVKKVLQIEFSIKMLSGSSTYNAAYASDSANKSVLASYGENITAQLVYSYFWSADEWNSNIAAGTNFLWSYDKQVQLGDKIYSLNDSSTHYTLVDMNRRGDGNTYYVKDGSILGNDTDAKAVFKFNGLTDFSSVYISDLLPLTVTEDNTNGTLKLLSNSSGATIRKWNEQKNQYDYYGPKTNKDTAGTTYYTVTVGNTDTSEICISETYYLIINCSKENGVITQDAKLGLEKFTSQSNDALPSKLRKKSESRYTLGKFFNISDVKITPTGEDGTGAIKLDTNDYIDVSLSAKVTVPEAYKVNFSSYVQEASTYFKFDVLLQNNGFGSGSDQVLTKDITVSEVKIGDTALAPGDYECSVQNGILSLVLLNKKGSDFLSNPVVTAKLRLSYEGKADVIDKQFPLKTDATKDEDVGVTFSTNAAIAYSRESLGSSAMSATGQNSTKFFRDKINLVEISYHANSTVSMDGNVSQLGINGKEVADKGGVLITTKGLYDASQVIGLNTVREDDAKYPYYFVGTLQLSKKTGGAGQATYQNVKLSDYFKTVSINGTETTDLNGCNEFKFEIQLTTEQVQNLSYKGIEIDISYFVKSDKEIEELGDLAQYANYKVTLSGHLANKEKVSLVDDVSDYIIYTNAKFYNGIISTRDFDNLSR